jgi:hypothetical protein
MEQYGEQMSKFKKFREWSEAKEKGFADENGAIPNQDVPKAGKYPDLMKLKSDKPLGGRDYQGQMGTNPIKGTEKDPLPYKGFDKTDQKKVGKGVLVNDEDGEDLKSGLTFKGNGIQTAKNSASLGEEPNLSNVEKIKHAKGNKMAEGFQTSHLGERQFNSFERWLRFVKAQFPGVRIEGNRDIAQALVGNKGVAEWDGERGVIYNPAPAAPMSHHMTSEQFIEQTKNMSPAEFISFFVEGSEEPLPTISDLYGNEFTPDPNQTIQYLAALMVKNPRLMSRFIREMKRHDKGMELMMDEHFNHPEFYASLAEGMGKPEEGRKRCHRIGRAMNDQYMDALEKFVMEQKMNEEVQDKADLMPEDGGPMGSGPQNPMGMGTPKMKPAQGGAIGGGGPTSQDMIPGGNGGIGGSPGAAPPGSPPGGAFGGGMGSPTDQGPGMGGPNGPQMPPGAGGGMGGGPGPMPPTGPSPMGGNASGGPPGLDMGTGGEPKGPMMPKLKGETAHGNIIEELGSYPAMFEHMSSYCLTCKDKHKK